jgi:hypothetical protein
MNLQEEHWTKLFAQITTENSPWYGIWSVFSPEKEIIKSAKGIRNLTANESKTVITHTNQFPSPDAVIPQKQWQIDKETCNLADGLLHPADPSKRAFSLYGNGSSSWFPKKLEIGKGFSVELFLRHEDWNYSIGSIYADTGKLEKILHMREHFGSFPETPLTPAIELESLSGKWTGTQVYMTPDLITSSPTTIEELIIDPSQGKNKTFSLPDGIVVNIPEILTLGEEFAISAARLVSDNYYQRLTTKYDQNGLFMMLIGEQFKRQN